MHAFFSKMTVGILAIVLAAGIFLISLAFLMYGAATGLETVFVKQPWLSWVVTGGCFLLGPVLFFTVRFSKGKQVPSELPALSATLMQKILDATDGIDIREWTRKHPYQSTGAAAAAGFVVAGKGTSDLTHIVREVLLPLLVVHLQSKQNSREIP
jgi:hypothetical protein